MPRADHPKIYLNAYWLFWVKVIKEMAGVRGTLILLAVRERCILASKGKRTPLSLPIENWLRRSLYKPACIRSLYKQTLLFLQFTSPRQICLDSSLIKPPMPKFLCPINSSQIYVSLSRKYEVACFGSLPGPISIKPLCAWVKFFFSSGKLVSCPATRTQEG